MLNVIVFVCGAALMALEIVAARVLAPALGNSIYVWGSVITTVMIALSAGYWAGGHIADRDDSKWMLAPIIAAAGVLTVCAPLMAKLVLIWSAGFGAAIGSLVAAALIFFLPAFLLAMVSPLAVRLATLSGIEHVGRSAGGLYAISTSGSIVGTLATAFWLIPLLSLEPLIVTIGFLLLACSMVSLMLPRFLRTGSEEPATGKSAGKKKSAKPASTGVQAPVTILAVTAALLVVGWVVGVAVLVTVARPPAYNAENEKVIYQADTAYHRISVSTSGTVQVLRFDKSNQTAISMRDGFTSMSEYPYYMDVAFKLKPDAKRVLVLGLGGGAIVKRWARYYPDLKIDAVEIDPAVIKVAYKYFGLPTNDPNIRIFNMDGRRYVQTTKDKYDIVIVDCYYADALPFHMATQDFFREVASDMTPGGVLGYNGTGSVSGANSKLFRSMYKTVGTVWSNVSVLPVHYGSESDPGRDTKLRNMEVFATDATVTPTQLASRLQGLEDGRITPAGLPDIARDLYTAPIDARDVPLLTDSHAPVDSLIRIQ